MKFTTPNKMDATLVANKCLHTPTPHSHQNKSQRATDDDAIRAYMSQSYIAVSVADPVHQVKTQLVNDLKDELIPTYLYVVDKDNYLNGILPVKSLLTADNSLFVSDIMRQTFFSVSPEQNRHDVSQLISQSGLDSVPVIHFGKLVGVLRPQDIAELIEDENTLDAQMQGATSPLEQPYLETSPITLWRKRVVWLLMLFVAEAYTSTVLHAFEDRLEAAISLAFFIPLLIGTGGNSGTQITSTLVRAMALGEVSLRNVWSVLKKEITTSLMVAVTMGFAGFVRAWFLGVGFEVMLVVGLTLISITVWSAIVSSIIPMLLKRFGVDPAVVSAPFIATLIDGTGLIIYFEIASHIMSQFA